MCQWYKKVHLSKQKPGQSGEQSHWQYRNTTAETRQFLSYQALQNNQSDLDPITFKDNLEKLLSEEHV